MSDLEDEFLKDFKDDDAEGEVGSEEEEDENEADVAEGTGNGADAEMEIELATDSDRPRAPLRESPEYVAFIETLSRAIDVPVDDKQAETLIEKCNSTLNRITSEIGAWHRRACRLYRDAFPELEKLVQDPVDFAKVVLKFGEADEADLTGVLPAATVMVIKVSKSTRVNSIALLEDKTEVRQAIGASNEIISLDHDMTILLKFLEAQMKRYAPNLYDLVGSRTAALLVGIAGGLNQLSKIPSNDIQVLGRNRNMRADTGVVHGSNAALHRHGGVLTQCPLLLSAPAHLRRRVLRVLAGRVALAARVDESKRDTLSGQIWREEILKKIDKWQDPGPGKSVKALPVPDAVKPKRRGGRRARALKEKLGMTAMRALANREKFGEANEDVEYSTAAMGLDLGMLTQAGNGRVRSVQAKDTQKLSQHAAKKLRQINTGSQHTSGFTSLAFTPVQGLELAPTPAPGATSSAAARKPSRPAVPLFNNSSK